MIARIQDRREAVIEVGDVVRMDWPQSNLHGITGAVKTIDGPRIGVSWPWGTGGLSTFYAVVQRRRVKVLKRRIGGGS